MTAYIFEQLIDFTRTSAGTFVGSNGLIQNTPASVNLLTWTQEFDNAAWSKLNGVVTANNTTAPDGTATADTFSDETATNVHGVRLPANPALSTTYAVSVYAKMGTRRYVSLSVSAASSAALYASVSFDLQSGAVVNTGAVGTGFSVVSSAIENAGNGWYRCIAVLAFGSAGTLPQAYISTGTDGSIGGFGLQNYTGTNGTVFLWGAQLELGSTATAYTRNVGGRFPARFDYDPVTLAPRGILIEDQRTNLLTYSEQFDNAVWIKTASTITSNAGTAPDGTLTADLLQDTTATSQHYINQNINVTSGQTYTISFYAKNNGYGKVTFTWPTGLSAFPSSNVTFTFATGAATVVGAGSASMTDVGDGWYRCVATNTASATVTGSNMYFSLNGLVSYTGTGTGGAYFWGAQLEAGAFATSYIPTVASQVTRTADQASIVAPMFAPWYNQTEGTFVVEAAIPPDRDDPAGNHYFSVSDGGTSNTIRALDINGTRAIISTGGVTQLDSTVGAEPTSAVKFALAFATNNAVFCVNGVLGTADTSVTLPVVNALAIGARGDFSSTSYANGHIRRITYYPVRLLDTQLQALTA